MKQFILKSLLIIVIILNIIILVISIQIIYPNSYSINSHEQNVRRSINKLQQNRYNKKIIIIGGSGCNMGINSELIQQSLNILTFNTGTHAGIGLVMQFEMFKEYIHNEDIVIVIPEYQQFFKKGFYGTETILRILFSTYLNGFKYMELNQLVHLVPFLGKNTSDWINSQSFEFKNGIIDSYSCKELNIYGDMNPNTRNKHKTIPIDEKLDVQNINMESINYCSYIKKYINNKNATFIFLPPAYQDSSYNQNKSFISKIEQLLKDKQCAFDNNPLEYIFCDSLFYDTPYHLTEYGTYIRTRKIISEIRKKISLEN